MRVEGCGKIEGVCNDVNEGFQVDSKFAVDENLCDVSNSWSGIIIDIDISANVLISSLEIICLQTM
jgi:hypothetical protein